MRAKRIALIVLACLLLANSAMAMSSPNYEIDWMVSMSGGGGSVSSTSYAADLTVGQTAVGASMSASYRAGMGFWYGIFRGLRELFLPLVIR